MKFIKTQSLSSDSLKALKNTNWLMLEKLLLLPLGLVLNVLLARHLGVEQLGHYSYILSLIFLVGPVATMGLGSLITRELVNHPNDKASILGASLLVRLMGCLVVMLGLFGYACFQSKQEQQWLLILGVAQVFSAFSFIDFFFQAKLTVKYSAFARLGTQIILFALRLTAILLDSSLQIFIWLFAVELLVNAVLFVGFYWYSSGSPTRWILDFKRAKGLLSQSYLLIFSGIAAVIYLKIDMVMLAKIAGHGETGLYAVASRLSEIWYFIPAAMVSSFFPMLLKSRQQDTELYKRKLQKLCDLLFIMSVVVILPVVWLSAPVIELLYGRDYVAASSILSVHIFAGVFIFMRALLSKWLIAEDLLRFSLISQGLGAVSNVAFNFLFIPKYGAIGAAWATLISYACASYFALFFSSHTRSFAFIMTRAMTFPLRLVFQRIS